jgi:putative endonuclease
MTIVVSAKIKTGGKDMYVYKLKCRDVSYYVGVTNDIQRRLSEHNEGADPECYTFRRRPVELVFCERFEDPMKAIALEKQLKGWSRKKKEALIARNWDKLRELAKCRNETSHENYRKAAFDSAQADSSGGAQANLSDSD